MRGRMQSYGINKGILLVFTENQSAGARNKTNAYSCARTTNAHACSVVKSVFTLRRPVTPGHESRTAFTIVTK